MREKTKRAIAIGSAGAIVVGSIITSLILTSPTPVTVEAHGWERTVKVLEYKTVTEKGDYVPSRGREFMRWEETRWDDDDGSTTTMYRYYIDKWVHVDTLRAAALDRKPHWPDPQGIPTGAPDKLGLKKLGNSSQRYGLVLRQEDPPETYTYDLAIDRWRSISPGEVLVARINVYGVVRSIERIEAE